jgi:hypothetical protein
LTPALGVDSDYLQLAHGNQVFEKFRIDEHLQGVNQLAVLGAGGPYAQPGTVLGTVRGEVGFCAAGAAAPGVLRLAAARAEGARPLRPYPRVV